MNNVVDGVIYVAPNGYDMVKVFPHGFVQPVNAIPKDRGDLIQEMSGKALNMLPEDAKMTEAFEKMGWKKASEVTDMKEKVKAMAYDFYMSEPEQYKSIDDAIKIFLNDYDKGAFSEMFINTNWEMRVGTK